MLTLAKPVQQVIMKQSLPGYAVQNDAVNREPTWVEDQKVPPTWSDNSGYISDGVGTVSECAVVGKICKTQTTYKALYINRASLCQGSGGMNVTMHANGDVEITCEEKL